MLPDRLLLEAQSLLAACRQKSIRLATAEGCTGGLIAAALTAIAGASDVLDRSFVAYSNEAKHDLLSVPLELVRDFGAVSEEVAQAMAEGALTRSRANLAVAVTGVTGPGGGSATKPVGFVCFGLAQTGQPVAGMRTVFPGDRSAIRAASVEQAIALIHARLRETA